MDEARAAENLQVIRTLMERSAIYRRALAPVSLAAGVLGVVAGTFGWWWDIDTARGFGLFWIGVAGVGFAVALSIVRWQALRDREAFWSPPARRVAQAMVPSLFAGLVAGLVVVLPAWRDPLHAWWLPGVWMLLFGVATHAAGFFTSRSMKYFAWAFAVLGGLFLLYVNARSHSAGMPALRWAHLAMGGTFGGFHLAYSAYLALTENRNSGV